MTPLRDATARAVSLAGRHGAATAILACAFAAMAAPFTMLPLVAGAVSPPGRWRWALAATATAVAAAWTLWAMPLDVASLVEAGVGGDGDDAFMARHVMGLRLGVTVTALAMVASGILLRQAWTSASPRDATARAALAVLLAAGAGSSVERVGTSLDLRNARVQGRAEATMDAYAQIGEMRGAVPGLDVDREQRILMDRSFRRGLGLPPSPEPAGAARFGRGV